MIRKYLRLWLSDSVVLTECLPGLDRAWQRWCCHPGPQEITLESYHPAAVVPTVLLRAARVMVRWLGSMACRSNPKTTGLTMSRPLKISRASCRRNRCGNHHALSAEIGDVF